MFLLDLFTPEFTQFLQLVLWISVPLFVISVFVTVLLHHRRKRRQKKSASLLPVRELAWQLPPLAQPLLARASKNVFMPKEEVLHWGNEPYKKDCIEDMLQAKQLQIDQLQQQLDVRIKSNWQQAHEHSTAMAQWQYNFDEVNVQVKRLEEQLQSKQQETDACMQALAAQAEENRQLQLNMQEKAAHVLQAQHDLGEANLLVKLLEGQLQSKQEEADTCLQTLAEKVEENKHLYKTIEEKATYITQAGAQLAVLQQEKEALQATITSMTNDLQSIEEKLVTARRIAKEYEQKWEQGSHLLSRIYRELSGNVPGDKFAASDNGQLLEVA
jgi:DNA repair exonuclease SbcCD ATPase subunit